MNKENGQFMVNIEGRKSTEYLTPEKAAVMLFNMGFRLEGNTSLPLTDTDNSVTLSNIALPHLEAYWADGTARDTDRFFDLLDVSDNYDEKGKMVDDYLEEMTEEFYKIRGNVDENTIDGYKKNLLLSGIFNNERTKRAWGVQDCFLGICKCSDEPEKYVDENYVAELVEAIKSRYPDSPNLWKSYASGDLKHVVKFKDLAICQMMILSKFCINGNGLSEYRADDMYRGTISTPSGYENVSKFFEEFAKRYPDVLDADMTGSHDSHMSIVSGKDSVVKKFRPGLHLALVEKMYPVVNIYFSKWKDKMTHLKDEKIEVDENGVVRSGQEVLTTPHALYLDLDGYWEFLTEENLVTSLERTENLRIRASTELAKLDLAKKRLKDLQKNSSKNG